MGLFQRDLAHELVPHDLANEGSEVESKFFDTCTKVEPRRYLLTVFGSEKDEDLQAALAQLKFARCSHLLTASLAVLPSMSLIPFAPFAEIASDLKR